MGRRKGRATTDIVGQAPINFPTGSVLDFAGSTAPDGWLLCFGQAVSRTEYAALFAALGTTYGVGDGSTTFNLPDCRGRVKAGKDNMGGSAAGQLTSALSGVDGATLGFKGGAQVHSIATDEVGQHNHTQISHNHTQSRHGHAMRMADDTQGNVGGGIMTGDQVNVQNYSANATTTLSNTKANQLQGTVAVNIGTAAVNQATPASSPHQNTQPTIIFNTIIKV